MPAKLRGFETRPVNGSQVNEMADSLRRVGKNNLADMVTTHCLSAEENGEVKLSCAHWQEIDDAIEALGAKNADLSLDEAVEFLSGTGMNVVVVDDESPSLGWTGEDGDIDGTTTDEEIAELDEIMQEADTELDAMAFPLCQCGCGFRTKGGRYLPGHDAKHKGALMRVLYYNEGFEAGEVAKLELQLRGWLKFYPAFAKNETKRARRANVARCQICGRPLVDEESIERGIGPVCAGKH
jgi:hypothetical protein